MSVSSTVIATAAEWTEIEPNGTEIVLQNEGSRSVRVHIGDTAPDDADVDDVGQRLMPDGDPMTFALEDGDSLWVRVISHQQARWCQINVWQEAA